MFLAEPKVPKRLKETQEWFASIITQPLKGNNRISYKTPNGKSIITEASKYITPSHTLQAHERIELYNQQYWWRLLSSMHEAFPLLVRLFGYDDFNAAIAIPYLKKFPPNYWTLNVLGNRLSKWIEKEYKSKDRELVLHSSLIDYAFNAAFFIHQLPLLTLEDLQNSSFMETKLYLQYHVTLFKLPYDLFSFRREILKESPEFWLENEFPQLVNEKKPYAFLISRKRNQNVTWKEISLVEHTILQKISLGTSVEQICQWIECQSKAIQEEAESKLTTWFQNWTTEGLLTKHKPERSSVSCFFCL